MSGSSGYGIYRILKTRIDLGLGGEDGKIVLYALYDNNEIKIFHFRSVDGEIGVHQGIKAPWRDFVNFVDGGQGEALPQVLQMVQDMEGILKDSGFYDLKENNITKINYVEKAFTRRASQLEEGEAAAFIKVEGITGLEAQELMERFPKPQSEAESGDGPEEKDGSSELPLIPGMTEQAKERPKVVLSCSAVLDPVKGTAASDVRVGDLVTIGVPEDSPLYTTMKVKSQSEGRTFDGKMDAVLTGISESDSDRLVLEFDLGDNVMAVVIAQKTLRIKVMSSSLQAQGIFSVLSPIQLAFAAGALLLMIAVLFLLLKG